MCLDKITKTYHHQDTGRGYGWKVLYARSLPGMVVYTSPIFPRKHWVPGIEEGPSKHGFYVFEKLKDAKMHQRAIGGVIVKVEWSCRRDRGIQFIYKLSPSGFHELLEDGRSEGRVLRVKYLKILPVSTQRLKSWQGEKYKNIKPRPAILF